MLNQATFWDKIARKYAAKPVDDEPAYEDTLARTRAYLGADDVVLELGCGTGTTALKLADAVGHITATDISPEMIAIANEKLGADGPGQVEFRASGIEDALRPDGGYDAVLAFNLLHLVEDLPGAVRTIRGLLKPGGVFISKSGAVAEAGWFLRRVMIPAMQLIGKAPYLNPLKTADFDRIIAGEGFDIVETHTYSGMAPTRFIVARVPE